MSQPTQLDKEILKYFDDPNERYSWMTFDDLKRHFNWVPVRTLRLRLVWLLDHSYIRLYGDSPPVFLLAGQKDPGGC